MTLDNENSPTKRRKSQRYSLGGGITEGVAGALTQPYDVALLKNCWVNRKIGAVMRRDAIGIGATVSATSAAFTGSPRSVGELVFSHTASTPYQSVPFVGFDAGGGSNTIIPHTASTGWGGLGAISGAVVYQNSARPGSMCMSPGSKLLYAQGDLRGYEYGDNWRILGVLTPTAAPTWVGNADAAGITPTANYQWRYSYYKSSTGLEGDLSPVSTGTGADATAKKYTVTMPTDTNASLWANKKRLYRVLDGGEKYYLVAEVAVATTTYVDYITDDNLTTYFGEIGSKSWPNFETYIIGKYASRMWAVDHATPTIVRYSDPYTDDANALEHWPEWNNKRFDDPVTGFAVIGGRLLVFHPKSVSYISGTSEDDFVVNTFRQGVGTLHHQSISTNGSSVVCLSESGWVDITKEGNSVISGPISESLLPLISTVYSGGFYAASTWYGAIDQFIFIIGAYNTSPVLGRSKIWGWCPTTSQWHEYTHGAIPDNNTLGGHPTVIYTPLPPAWAYMPRPPSAYLGYNKEPAKHIGTICRFMDCTLSASSDADNNLTSSPFQAQVLTQRLAPGNPGGSKWFTHIGFPTANVDPQSLTCSLNYLLDVDDPAITDYSASRIAIPSDSSEVKTLPSGLGHFINLEVLDTTDTKNKVILQDFDVHYHERRRRENR